ncbi:MAG: DUF2461 domain-containing protein [Planctomycetaceae bacterium]|jgi:uncharacterized protein (TIGR02453 family)|nr:DUF2461 domain-containing protein [Planctomycetaceae bacterium]
MKFPGFSPKALEFFHNLERNNNREWFAGHRSEYVQYVADPMKQLAEVMIPMVQELDPNVVSDPKRVCSRIYRDTRFSHNKLPYRPNVWLAFRRNVDCWAETPVYFFEIKEKEYLFGMGAYSAKAATMQNFRSRIDNDPEEFLRVIKPFRKDKELRLESEQYKRPLPCAHPKEIVLWYQSKSVALIGSKEPDKTLLSPKIVDFLMDKFVLLKPLYDYLWKSHL